jgi:hypothetical protein
MGVMMNVAIDAQPRQSTCAGGSVRALSVTRRPRGPPNIGEKPDENF